MNSNINKISGDKLYAADIMNIVQAVNSKQDAFNLNDYLLKSELPTLSGGTGTDLNNYYTKSQIDDKGYLTSFTQDFNYNSLTNRPLLFSGKYSDLLGLPVIPDLSGYATEQYVTSRGYITSFTQNFDYSSLINKPDLTVFQLKGNYLTAVNWNDINGKPTLVDAYSKIESDGRYLTTGTTFPFFTQNFEYSALLNKPVIPSIDGLVTEIFVISKGYLTGVTFANISGKPTTLVGFGITDAVSTTSLTTKADLSLAITSKAANYTLVLTDNGKMISMNIANANALAIPTNASVALPIGAQILVYQEGLGQTTITPASGVTINSVGGKSKITGQYSTVTLIKKATNIWAIIGDLS